MLASPVLDHVDRTVAIAVPASAPMMRWAPFQSTSPRPWFALWTMSTVRTGHTR